MYCSKMPGFMKTKKYVYVLRWIKKNLYLKAQCPEVTKGH